MNFKEFLNSEIKDDWLEITKKFFPDGEINQYTREPDVIQYSASDSNRLIDIKFFLATINGNTKPTVSLDFAWMEPKASEKSEKDHAIYGYHSLSKFDVGSIYFLKKIKSYFESIKKIGVNIEMTPADMGVKSRRQRLFGKIIQRSGYNPIGKGWSSDGLEKTIYEPS